MLICSVTFGLVNALLVYFGQSHRWHDEVPKFDGHTLRNEVFNVPTKG
jgi:hypothetical protein